MSEKISNPSARSTCPIANSLDLIGDKWTLLIFRDLFRGKSKYGDFAGSAEGIPTNILASRLRSLEESGLIYKKPYSEKPPRNEYFLTDQGKRLGELVRFLKDWGVENIEGTSV
ncbi:MAG: helix-turn-helix transcriptional regulator [Pyrinomonadaceae bacterium]|nr:helix-turn-helix transcriptional regulator [Pyrinomonadaceae bacterium]